MIIEKDRIYKVLHSDVPFRRDYIIFSPREDIDLGGEIEEMNWPRQIFTHFTVCFDGAILTKYSTNEKGDSEPSSTGIDRRCRLEKLTNADYDDIKRAMRLLGNNHHYNRKLNKVVYGI